MNNGLRELFPETGLKPAFWYLLSGICLAVGYIWNLWYVQVAGWGWLAVGAIESYNAYQKYKRSKPQ